MDEDPRVPILVLAQRLGLVRGTVQSRLERMTASGALRPNSSRVLPAALERGVAASVSAELDRCRDSTVHYRLRTVPPTPAARSRRRASSGATYSPTVPKDASVATDVTTVCG